MEPGVYDEVGRTFRREKMSLTIQGWPCKIRSPNLQKAISLVLRSVSKTHPEDYQRLMKRVSEFGPLSMRDRKDGIVGWYGKRRRSGEYDFDSPGSILLREDDSFSIATVAHELGHACTREDDFWKRDGLDAEWASELCADMYAYKWGFGREIARSRKERDFMHHGPPPGTVVECNGSRFRVTRAFYIRPF